MPSLAVRRASGVRYTNVEETPHGRTLRQQQAQRAIVLTARFNEQQEARAIRAAADRTGLSVGALVRHALLNVAPPHARHRPSVDHQAVARLLGGLGKIGLEY